MKGCIKIRKAILIIAMFIIIAVLLAGCGDKFGRYQYTFFEAFNTSFQLIGYTSSKAEFDLIANSIEEKIRYLHKLYDKYNSYEGLNNIKTVNDNAGIAPVEVPGELLDLAELCLSWMKETGGKVDISLGPILEIWQTYMEEGQSKPPWDLLEAASVFQGVEDIVIDRTAGTLFLKRKGMSLDLGSCAKGYAAGLAIESLEPGASVLLNAGGNVVVSGKPLDGRDSWNIGIQDPDSDSPDTPMVYVSIENGAVVTSGDYQRFYTVDGERLCHIIDPDTLLPASLYRSVSVICPESGVADILSTALYLLPYERGKTLIEELGYGAVWIYPDRTVKMAGTALYRAKL